MRKFTARAGGWVAMLVAGAFVGCTPDLGEDRVEGLRHLRGPLSTNGAGLGSLNFKVNPGETAMLITGRTGSSDRVHVRELWGLKGGQVFSATDHLGSSYSKTNAAFISPVVSLGWPVDQTDGPLAEGRWSLTMALADTDDEWAMGEVEVDVLLKEDDDFSRGQVHATIVFVGEIEEDPELVRGTEAALEVWADLYSRVGLSLSWELMSYPHGDLFPPGFGSGADYEALSEQTRLRSVRVVISDTIQEFPDVYGMAGDIPGPLVPSPKTAVVVSAQLAAGVDGVFSEAETRLFGETLAHEAGHFLGLFHPVEVSFDRWDALADTPECHSQSECVELLGMNLMFPFPVCNFVACIPQDELSPLQASVTHRHVAVD